MGRPPVGVWGDEGEPVNQRLDAFLRANGEDAGMA
jgi:hypothetical protein